MIELKALFDRIIQRTNINLRDFDLDVGSQIQELIPLRQLKKFYAFYGISPNHPVDFQFRHSSLSGSYFLGRCKVTNAVLYKSDIRGDELKKKGDSIKSGKLDIPIQRDESMDIQDSLLIKTLVHNSSHDPETPEVFSIRDTVALHFANIHGAPSRGCFLEPFSTVDLTTMKDCIVGTYSYVQAGEINRLNIKPGTIWVQVPNNFNFQYQFPQDQLKEYVHFSKGSIPEGILMDFIADRKEDFQQVFEMVNKEQTISVPESTSLDRYAVAKSDNHIDENVLISQRAYLQNAWMGKGSNAQENCIIINSRLEGFNVTAHGAKIIEADLGENVFVGFNSFLRAKPNERTKSRLTVGKGTIIVPHTIIDIDGQLVIPEDTLVWGLIRNNEDLELNSVPIESFKKVKNGYSSGNMDFEGIGANFVTAFRDRINHILEANGAFFDGKNNKGHAQKNRNMSFNTIQPYLEGDLEGLYPIITIQP